MAGPRHVRIGEFAVGNDLPLALIAGPCVIESRDHALETAQALVEMTRARDIPLIYKSSFDKANRTSAARLNLGFYLAAVATVMVSAVWSSTVSWRNRMPAAHAMSQVLFIWGLVLGAGQVLPRVGYAKDLATWRCVAPPQLVVPDISTSTDGLDETAVPVEEAPAMVPDSSG